MTSKSDVNSRIRETLNLSTNAVCSTDTNKIHKIGWEEEPKPPFPERLVVGRRPLKKNAANGTHDTRVTDIAT